MYRKDMYVGQLVTNGLGYWAQWYRVLSVAPHSSYGEPVKGGRYVKLAPGTWNERNSIFTENDHGATRALKPADLHEAHEWRVTQLLADERAIVRRNNNLPHLMKLAQVRTFFHGLGFTDEEIESRVVSISEHTNIKGDDIVVDWGWCYRVRDVLPRMLVELGVIEKDEKDEKGDS